MKRIQNPNGFILQNGFTFLENGFTFFAKNGFKFNDRFKSHLFHYLMGDFHGLCILQLVHHISFETLSP